MSGMFNATATTAAAGLRIGTRPHTGGGHTGVLRRDRAVLAECGHTHTNRDQSTRANGTSAADCIRDLVRAATRPDYADHCAAQIGAAWRTLTSPAGFGFSVPASTVERARAAAPANVAAYRATVAQVAATLTTGGER